MNERICLEMFSRVFIGHSESGHSLDVELVGKGGALLQDSERMKDDHDPRALATTPAVVFIAWIFPTDPEPPKRSSIPSQRADLLHTLIDRSIVDDLQNV
jgi:hypothetical protein